MNKILLLVLYFCFISCSHQTTKTVQTLQTHPFVLDNKGWQIRGEINTAEKSETVVLFLHGSGVHDRYQTIPAMFTSTGKDELFFKELNDRLIKKGLSTVLYDKRGYPQDKVSEEILKSASFENIKSDALKVVEYIKQTKKFKRLILLGHSEGTVIASEISFQMKNDPFLVKLILISTLAINLKDSLHEQMTLGMSRNVFVEADQNKDGKIYPEEVPPHMIKTLPFDKLDPYKRGYISQGDLLRVLEKQFKGMIDFISQDDQNTLVMNKPTSWFREFMNRPTLIDRAQEYVVPVVFIHGKLDSQTPFNTNALPLSNRLRFFKKKVQLVALPELGHGLSPMKDNLPTLGPMAPEAVEEIVKVIP